MKMSTIVDGITIEAETVENGIQCNIAGTSTGSHTPHVTFALTYKQILIKRSLEDQVWAAASAGNPALGHAQQAAAHQLQVV